MHMTSQTSLLFKVVDFWAFSTAEWGKEILSMHHTRNALQKLTPQVGPLLCIMIRVIEGYVSMK